jgi:hypothetical protein
VKPVLMRAALRAVSDNEVALAHELRAVGQRHVADHDVYHLTHQLANLCERHVETLRPHALRYGEELPEDDLSLFSGLIATVRRRAGEMLGRNEKGGALLLKDLRDLYVQAAECNVSWTIASQGAKAARDEELVEAVYACQDETGRILKWIETRLKQTAPQVLAG